MAASQTIDRERLGRLMATEIERFTIAHPRAAALHERARSSLLEGVPMP